MPTTIGELTNVPVPGDPIRSPWAQQVSDRIIHRFASVGALKAAVPVPADGMRAWIMADDAECVGKGGTWRYLIRDTGHATGNQSWITFNATNASPSTSNSGLSISGRTITLRGQLTLAAGATSGNLILATLAAPYRTPTALNLPGAMLGTAPNSYGARVILATNGDLSAVWGTAPAGQTALLVSISWAVADLVAA